MTDVRLLSYDEIAVAFGITRESARQLVIRKRWARTRGNDNKARIQVPIEALDTGRPSDDTGRYPSGDTGQITSHSTGQDPSESPSALAVASVLSRHIERLEGELSDTKAALDAERAIAAQVEALRSVLEVERARMNAAEQDRDRWYAEAQQDRAARLADAENAQAQADLLRAELAALKARPWWQRAFG